jgi:peptidoglycan/LPS O-acetylase OafA/YrhL
MCAEEQLYVLIPILCFLAARWRWPILLALIAVAPVGRWLVADQLPYPAVWNFTTSHLDVFAIGVALASLDSARDDRWLHVRAVIAHSRPVLVVVGALAVVLIASAAIDPQWVYGSGASSWTYLLVAVVWAWLLVRLTPGPQPPVSRPVAAAVWMGRRSYGIYVCHWPLVLFGLWLGSVTPIPLPVIGAALVVAVLAISEASFRWIESPFLRLKARFSRDPAPAT